MGSDHTDRAEGLGIALDLFAAAEALIRQKLRRRQPEACPDEIEAGIVAWLAERPGAENGDAPGHPAPWPRR